MKTYEMTERERLIELYKRATIYAHENYDGDEFDHDKLCDLKVDYLLSNGVIVPPCKVGTWCIIWQQSVTNVTKETVIVILVAKNLVA